MQVIECDKDSCIINVHIGIQWYMGFHSISTLQSLTTSSRQINLQFSSVVYSVVYSV